MSRQYARSGGTKSIGRGYVGAGSFVLFFCVSPPKSSLKSAKSLFFVCPTVCVGGGGGDGNTAAADLTIAYRHNPPVLTKMSLQISRKTIE